MRQQLKWLASWVAAALACAAGMILARDPSWWPTTQQLLIATAVVVAIGFVLATVRAHVRPGTSYFGLVALVVIVVCLVAAVPIAIDTRTQAFGLVAGAVLLLVLARPSRQPGQNIVATGPTPTIVWAGKLDPVPRITVLLGYVTIDATGCDWSAVNEVQVTLVASRLELIVPTFLDNVDVTGSGLSVSAEGPSATDENPLRISAVGALAAVLVQSSSHPGISSSEGGSNAANPSSVTPSVD